MGMFRVIYFNSACLQRMFVVCCRFFQTVWTQIRPDRTPEMVQRRAARWTLCRLTSYDSVSDMLCDLGWRSLEDRRTDSRLCLFYKIVHGLVAVPLPPYVVHTQVLTRHSASHPLAFRQIYTVADYYKYSFFPLAIVQWKRLPPSVALLPDIDSFRRKHCF